MIKYVFSLTIINSSTNLAVSLKNFSFLWFSFNLHKQIIFQIEKVDVFNLFLLDKEGKRAITEKINRDKLLGK
jgi:hypothetical protein